MGRGEGADALAEAGAARGGDAEDLLQALEGEELYSAEQLSQNPIFRAKRLLNTPSPSAGFSRSAAVDEEMHQTGRWVCQQLKEARSPEQISEAAQRFTQWLAACAKPTGVDSYGRPQKSPARWYGVNGAQLNVLQDSALVLWHDQTPEAASQAWRALDRVLGERELEEELKAPFSTKVEIARDWLGGASDFELAEVCGVTPQTFSGWLRTNAPSHNAAAIQRVVPTLAYWVQRDLGWNAAEFWAWAERAPHDNKRWSETIREAAFWRRGGAAEIVLKELREEGASRG